MGSRLRFAIAAAKHHEVLLIDEALATGDAEFRVRSHNRINELRAAAGTVFLVAHDLEEVELTCNRVIWMDRGKIVMQGDDVIGIIDKYIDASGGIPSRARPGHQAAAASADRRPRASAAASRIRRRGVSSLGRVLAGRRRSPAAVSHRLAARGRCRLAGARQPQPHDRAAAVAPVGGDLAVLRLGELPDDVKAEPDAAEPAPVACLALDEPLEHALPVLRPDADALVRNLDLDRLAVRPGPDGDRAALR